MTTLKSLTVGGIVMVVLTTISVTFVADGLSIYGNTAGNVQQGKLNQISNLSDADVGSLSDTAQQSAEGINPKENFFTLPGLVSTFGIVFEVVPVFEALANQAMITFGLAELPIIVQGVFAIIGVVIAFTFARRIIG